MENIYSHQILKILFKNMSGRTREDAVNAIFSQYWQDIFKESVLCHTSFIRYHKNVIYISLISINRDDFNQHFPRIFSTMKGIIGDDLKKLEFLEGTINEQRQ